MGHTVCQAECPAYGVVVWCLMVADNRVCAEVRCVKGVSGHLTDTRWEISIHGVDEVGGELGGMFHASASVSRWEKNCDGKHERATIAGIRAARGEGEQGVMAHECETLDSNEQSGTDAQTIDRQKPVLGTGFSLPNAVWRPRATATRLCPADAVCRPRATTTRLCSANAVCRPRATARVPSLHPLHPRPYNERCRCYCTGRREHSIGGGASLVGGFAFHHRAGGGFPASGDGEKAWVEHEARHE